ncbi:RNase II stability modulator [Pantoea agglomerans]|uniref:RNase II stability modulator n=1 Tax=Enterobacter agglomerans TaxID=549 RepID=A0A379AFG8_ENTAG|nr:RNase II stability modulator [Pantoea agglomerans]
MTDEQGQTLLYTLFGTTSPHWRLTADSDALHFAEDESSQTNIALPVNPRPGSHDTRDAGHHFKHQSDHDAAGH